MLVFATEFPSARSRTTSDFIEIAKEWLTGSPNNEWSDSDFHTEPQNALTVYSAHGQTVSVGLLDNERGQYAGLRHQWTENAEREWVTELVAKHQIDHLWISVRLYCTLLKARLRLPTPRKPYIIKKLFEDLGGGNDGTLMAADWPHYLNEKDLRDAAQMIQGAAGNRLPIVYVSRDFQNDLRVDAEGLGERLSGMAHVVVEPSRSFAHRLMHTAGGNNAYGGAVGIYWPDGAGAHIRIIPKEHDTPRRMEDEIRERVRLALCTMRATPDCTWGFLNELLSQHRIDTLKASGSTALNEYVEAFDAEFYAKDMRLREAENEIVRLHAEIRRFELARPAAGEGVLKIGKEQDLYPGEIRDVIIGILRESLTKVDSNSRKRHIVDDLLAANKESGIRDNIIDEIKRALPKEGLGNREMNALQAANFTIADEGKHYKAVYCGDGRYTFIISKTSSDHRAGKNLASDVVRKLFR